MNHYEAIRNLSPENMEKFLDQVFLTGFNSGHQALVDPGIDDENPYDSVWLDTDVEASPNLIEDEAGESLIVGPLARVLIRMAEFDEDSMPENISWEASIILPKGIGDESDTIDE